MGKGKTKLQNEAVKGGKTASVVALMQRADGATVEEMMKATGWQAHSVRGVISGQIKKKMGFEVVRTKGSYGTVYRIAEEKSA